MSRRVRERGRVKKVVKSPSEMISERLNDVSNIFPKTKARIIGAGGKSSFFNAGQRFRNGLI